MLLNSSFADDTDRLSKLRALAQAAQKDIYALGVELTQYGAYRTKLNIAGMVIHHFDKSVYENVTLLRHKLFDPDYPTFHYVAWLLAMDWAMNNREVISFQGDVDWANVISTSTNDIATKIDSLEIPINVVSYVRYACVYVTGVIICIAIIASLYFVLHNGHVEGLNLIEINRVAGLVWIGRPLLLIRSIAAICLLSTDVMSLEVTNNMTQFVAISEVVNETSAHKAIRLFKAFLAAGEVSWLCFVLNDVMMIITAQYTTIYVTECTILLWGIATLLSWSAPPIHTATIQRECTFPHLDYQLVCTSGVISIGSVSRFMSLSGICILSSALCYIFERIRQILLPPPQRSSLFLSVSAKYMFQSNEWMHENIYWIDQASAAINGTLSLRMGNIFYVFDIKIWRLFVLEVSKETRERLKRDEKFHMTSAIPLTN
ncbi:hypothetical protein LEN26_008064 [Aphanomyces euteiches]|nr:hypothetical protein AeMF1_012456 [Aphanomyces euteiches]KAH9130943.1 hypothetical protein LEN26_008064 [Aphanomyces euteiches]KAH9187555.1 hypothetical protein AeNC1_010469 [Aphanomyces euteiches]